LQSRNLVSHVRSTEGLVKVNSLVITEISCEELSSLQERLEFKEKELFKQKQIESQISLELQTFQ